jgi:homoserine kinase type II
MYQSPGKMCDKGLDPGIPVSIAEVLDHYELGEIVSLVGLRSRTNENYLLTTRDGRYVLRGSHRSRSPESLAFEHRLLRYLTHRGFPVIQPLLSRDMETWVALDGGLWTLCRYVGGEQLDRTRPSHLAVAARALAAYHRIAPDFERSDEKCVGTWNIERWLKTTVEATACFRPSELPEIEASRAYLVESLDCLSCALSSPDITQLWKVVIHGDFSRRNILFQQDQLLAVLDFDGCHFEFRAMDLAIALKNICRGLDKHSQLNMARVRAFMTAYKAEEPLSDGELVAIPRMLQAHRLRSLVARYERLCLAQRRKEHRTEKFLSEVARLRWLKDHRNEIVDALYG